jgi:hypothetical protein
MPTEPKTRWRDEQGKVNSVQFSDLTDSLRLDANYYAAEQTLKKLLKELRHNTSPTLTTFIDNIFFMLYHPALIDQAKKNWAAAVKEATGGEKKDEQ